MNLLRRERVERRLAAILAADVAGYARLMSEDEEGTLAELRAWRHEVADPHIRERHGRIIKATGDGFLVEFPSVVDGDPLADIALLDGQGEHLSVIMKDGVLHKRMR